MVGFYESGFPYTGTYEKGDGEPVADDFNKYAKRSPAFKQVYIAFSKYISLQYMKLSLGMNIFNVFNIRNINNIYPETGEPDKRSEYYMKEVKLPELGGTKSRTYYDAPWMFGKPREINVFIRIDYK